MKKHSLKKLQLKSAPIESLGAASGGAFTDTFYSNNPDCMSGTCSRNCSNYVGCTNSGFDTCIRSQIIACG